MKKLGQIETVALVKEFHVSCHKKSSVLFAIDLYHGNSKAIFLDNNLEFPHMEPLQNPDGTFRELLWNPDLYGTLAGPAWRRYATVMVPL